MGSRKGEARGGSLTQILTELTKPHHSDPTSGQLLLLLYAHLQCVSRRPYKPDVTGGIKDVHAPSDAKMFVRFVRQLDAWTVRDDSGAKKTMANGEESTGGPIGELFLG